MAKQYLWQFFHILTLDVTSDEKNPEGMIAKAAKGASIANCEQNKSFRIEENKRRRNKFIFTLSD